MPSLKKHLEFDEKKLKRYNVIYDTDGTKVHQRLDKGAKKYGPTHREDDYWHSDIGIRDTIDNNIASICNIYPETATDYIRIAYGHICLDTIASKYKREIGCNYTDLSQDDWRIIFNRAYHKFKRNRYHKTVYQPRR